MYTDNMMFWLSLAILGSVSMADEHWGEEFPWRVAETRQVTLEPSSCQNFEFVLPAESVGRLSFSDSEIPSECYPEATLWMTSELYQNGYCLDWDYRTDKCLAPDISGLLFKEELCKNWDFLSLTYFQPTLNTTTDSNCLGDQKYFFAMRSSCYWPINITLKMETRNLTMDEDVVCTVLGDLLNLKVFKVVKVVAVLVCVVLVAAVVLCCCCCCPCCYLFKKIHQHRVLASMREAGYVPILDEEGSVIGTPVSQGVPFFSYPDDKMAVVEFPTEENSQKADS